MRGVCFRSASTHMPLNSMRAQALELVVQKIGVVELVADNLPPRVTMKKPESFQNEECIRLRNRDCIRHRIVNSSGINGKADGGTLAKMHKLARQELRVVRIVTTLHLLQVYAILLMRREIFIRKMERIDRNSLNMKSGLPPTSQPLRKCNKH